MGFVSTVIEQFFFSQTIYKFKQQETMMIKIMFSKLQLLYFQAPNYRMNTL